MVVSSAMVVFSSVVQFLHFQPNTYFLPFHPSVPSLQCSNKKKKGIRKNIFFTAITHSPLPLFNNHFVSSTHLQNSFSCCCSSSVSAQDPDAHLLNSLLVEQLIDPTILASWLRNCNSVREVRRIHPLVIKKYHGMSSVTYVYNNLVSVYVRLGKLLDARKVFDQMLLRNVVSWTAILNGYLKLGSDDEVLKIFNELMEVGVQPNSKTFVCVLNLCVRRADFELGRQIHACIVKGSWSNLIVDCAIIHFYAQCGDLSDAFQAFSVMPERDVISWTTMVTACAQHADGEEAFLMFFRMQLEGFFPNEFTVCSVLKACGKMKALKLGRQLHGAIVKKMFRDDVFIGTSTVGMYVKCEDIASARRVFDQMKKRNTVTWTSMIAGYAQNGLGEEAISLFRVMKRRHIFANHMTILSILRACGLVRHKMLGKEVHAQIVKNSIQNNRYIGSNLVWFYCRCEDHVSAAKVLQMMPQRDVISWTAIISGYARLGHGSQALDFLNNMLWEGIEPNSFTYSSALKACARLEAILQGKLIHSSVNKSPALSNVFVGSALIDMYAKCGYVAEATRVFDTMPERNLVSWKAMIVAYARNGYCQEALKLMYRMQAEGIDVDDHIQNTVISACGDIEWDKGSLPEHSSLPS